MVASINGRIDCSIIEKISGDKYYTTLEKLDCRRKETYVQKLENDVIWLRYNI